MAREEYDLSVDDYRPMALAALEGLDDSDELGSDDDAEGDDGIDAPAEP